MIAWRQLHPGNVPRALEACLSCRNVVRVLDSRLDAKPPFVVLDCLGHDIEHNLPEEGATSHYCLEVMRDVASALESIHALGDYHGDVKPENILMHPAT